MSRTPSRSSMVATLAVALLVAAGSAQAIIIICDHWFPFGVINGNQVARFSAVLTPPPDETMACPASMTLPLTMTFFDSQGVAFGDPNEKTLRQGVIVTTDFLGDPGIKTGQRLEIQAEGAVDTRPNVLPPGPCHAQVLFSMQVLNRKDMTTQFIMTDRVMVDIAGSN
jgi:hypothetical protein